MAEASALWPLVADDYPLGDSLVWEAHGLQLARRLTGAEFEGIATVQSLRTDQFLGSGKSTDDFFNPIKYDSYRTSSRGA